MLDDCLVNEASSVLLGVNESISNLALGFSLDSVFGLVDSSLFFNDKESSQIFVLLSDYYNHIAEIEKNLAAHYTPMEEYNMKNYWKFMDHVSNVDLGFSLDSVFGSGIKSFYIDLLFSEVNKKVNLDEVDAYVSDCKERLASGKYLCFKNKELWHYEAFFNYVILPKWLDYQKNNLEKLKLKAPDPNRVPSPPWLRANRFGSFVNPINIQKNLSKKYEINNFNDFLKSLGFELNFDKTDSWVGMSLEDFVSYFNSEVLPLWGNFKQAPTIYWLIANDFGSFVSVISSRKLLSEYEINGFSDFWPHVNLNPNKKVNPVWSPWQELLGDILSESYSSVVSNRKYKNTRKMPDYVVSLNGSKFVFDAKCNPWQTDIICKKGTIEKYTKLDGNKRLFICYLDGNGFDERYVDKKYSGYYSKITEANGVPVVFLSGFELVNQLVPEGKREFYINKINALVDEYRGVSKSQKKIDDFI